jgi:hypothetical protein
VTSDQTPVFTEIPVEWSIWQPLLLRRPIWILVPSNSCYSGILELRAEFRCRAIGQDQGMLVVGPVLHCERMASCSLDAPLALHMHHHGPLHASPSKPPRPPSPEWGNAITFTPCVASNRGFTPICELHLAVSEPVPEISVNGHWPESGPTARE